MLIVFLIYIIVVGILFFKAPIIAPKISDNSKETSLQINNYEKLTAILFATVGLLIFFNALQSFIGSIGSVYNGRGVNIQNSNQLVRKMKMLLFGGGIQMLIGVVLFFGGKKIASWWYDFRNWT